jgi:Oxidoreductase molybdopterin binding domain
MSLRARIAETVGAALIALTWNAWADEPALTVHGIGTDPLKLTIADIRKFPSQKIHAVQENGTAADFDCTSIANVLSGAGASLGKSLRGKRLSEYLLVKAADGYEVVFALPELDPEFTDQLVLLCYLKDGAALPETEGPLRLVVPEEKRHARWVRKVTDFFLEKRP